MDDYIWQRRIHHGVRHQKSAVPFPESVKIGLEFNAALEKEEKLAESLLTNAVILELCSFARTVTRSETYFLFEMLEFNFNLGLDMDNERQCYEYARRVNNKIKLLRDQIKTKPRKWTEPFQLPDPNSVLGCTVSEQRGHFYGKITKNVDISVLTDGRRSSRSSEDLKTDSNGAASSEFIVKKRGGIILKLTLDSYPFCRELGVTLLVRPEDTPKQKLDPNLVTNGVMLELLAFSRVLCATETGIVHDLVKHNFGQEMDNTLFRMHISRITERKNTFQVAEDRDAFLKEPFKVKTKTQNQEPKHRKRKRNPLEFEDMERLMMVCKRRETLRHRDSDLKEIWQDSDQSYMCPVDFETEKQLGSLAGPENVTPEGCLSETAAEIKPEVCLGVKQEEKEVFISPVKPRTMTGQNFRPAVSDLFHEDKNEDLKVKTLKQKLWTRRAPRSKLILKSSQVHDRYARCRDVGLDFNVGSGKKWSLDLRLLTNGLLWEVYKFSTAMTRGLRSFLFTILDKNFNLVFQDEVRRCKFLFFIMQKEKILQNHPARCNVEFLSSPFKFPEVYKMPDRASDLQAEPDAEGEQKTIVDSPALTADHRPFCRRLGLNLWSTEQRAAGHKLDLSVLTTGAVFEIFSFIRELCGDVRELVNDVLEHNFDLDLQSGETEAAQVIQRWYVTQKSLMIKGQQHLTRKASKWLNMVVSLNGLSPQTGNHLQDLDPEDFKPKQEMRAFSGNVPLVKRINRFQICTEIGLDLDVHSKSKAKTKLDLGLLTRGVLFEMHQYVKQNCQRYVPALYEILDYNFDLSSQNHRKVEFAWSFASQVIAIAGKNDRKGDYLNRVIELPFEVPESSQIICKEEPEDGFGEPDLNVNSDVMFVRELKPVDIEVQID